MIRQQARRAVRFRLPVLLFLLVSALLWPVRASRAVQQAGEPVVRFAVIGDQGTGDKHQYRVAEQMVRWHDALPYPVVLTLGDNIYGPTLAWWRHGGKQYFEKRFDRPYAELLERDVIFRASLGNHDLRTHDGRDQIEDYERFHIEGEQGYYNFTHGKLADGRPLVEFFALNTTRLEKDKQDPEQLAWLAKALASSRARWKILYGHHPLYSSGKRHGGEENLRKKVEPILLGEETRPSGAPFDYAQDRKALKDRGRVDVGPEGATPSIQTDTPRAEEPWVQVALAGHDHFYQRFHPQQGVTYFVCGSSGQLRRGNAKPDPSVAAIEDQLRAFMLWEATASELRYRAINERGEAFDCGRIRDGGKVESVPCGEWPGLTNSSD